MAYHLCSELVSVAWDETGGFGNLEEIGEWTAVLLLEDPVPTGARIVIQCKEHQLNGYVETCNYEDPLGFFVSVRLDPDCRWSADWFSPQHLLTFPAQLSTKAFALPIASGY
ncbi:MAG: hypothetical protein M3O35_01265 [Acidobacteriota bacterium]|nr:hypothetical protein [Acidobacteriota bacterium]